MSSVRPSVRPHFSKQNKFQAKTMFATGETLSLAEWIIDDICHVLRTSTPRVKNEFRIIYEGLLVILSLSTCTDQIGRKKFPLDTDSEVFGHSQLQTLLCKL